MSRGWTHFNTESYGSGDDALPHLSLSYFDQDREGKSAFQSLLLRLRLRVSTSLLAHLRKLFSLCILPLTITTVAYSVLLVATAVGSHIASVQYYLMRLRSLCCHRRNKFRVREDGQHSSHVSKTSIAIELIGALTNPASSSSEESGDDSDGGEERTNSSYSIS